MSVGKRLVVLACLAAASLAGVRGQSPGDLNEGSRVEWDSANAIWRLKWWGRSGHTYFIQQTDNLQDPWEWVPMIERGNDSIREWGFTTTGDRFFVRLRHTDVATNDAASADFDGDGVSNLDEVTQGTDPFSAVDADLSGLPDDWETRYFAALGQDPNADPDSDGIKNKYEVMLGTSPWVAQPGPANFQMVQNADRSCDFTWEDQSGGANGHIIIRFNDDGTEDVLGVAPAGVTTFHWKNEDPE
jgi:hypothetical protein